MLKKIESEFNLYVSIAFEKEITKYGKIIHVIYLIKNNCYLEAERKNKLCLHKGGR